MTYELLDGAIDRELTAIRYVGLPWEHEPTRGAIVDAVSRAVLLEFGTLTLQVRWLLEPPIERLAVESPTAWQALPLAKVVDASGRWAALLGTRLLKYEVGFQEVESGREPWALLLHLEDAGRLLIALGELDDGVPKYLPDSLVVTEDATTARQYVPNASEGSLWM